MELKLDLSKLAPTTQQKVIDKIQEVLLRDARDIQEDLTYYTPDDRTDSAYSEMVRWANGAMNLHGDISKQSKAQQG